MELDKIIGTKNPDGTRVLPALNIHGKPYFTGRGVSLTTIGVAPGKFVVVPNNFRDLELLEQVKTAVKAPSAESFSTRRKSEAMNAGE
jgi:hypothetical protein